MNADTVFADDAIRSLFAQTEVQAIVKKRRQLDLTIARSGTTMLDYLRYLEYEINLDALRQARRKRIGARQCVHACPLLDVTRHARSTQVESWRVRVLGRDAHSQHL